MFTYSVWIPAERLHTLRELHSLAKARFAHKDYTLKPYVHVAGRLHGLMSSDKYMKLLEDIYIAGLPNEARNLEEALRAIMCVPKAA